MSSGAYISGKIYAFQEGSPRTAQEKWESKGVTAISYSNKNSHIALWDTLKAWSEKSKDHECWYNNIIAKTQKTPNSLSAYERSQVAYIVSHKEGAKKFADSIPAPRAEWLCVFDEKCRYADSSSNSPFHRKEKFKRYRLDIDKQIPDKLNNNEKSSWLKGNVWGAFKINEYDLRELNKENIISITGSSYCPLPPRIRELGNWLTKVSDQPAAVWWVAQQPGIHPHIKDGICLHFFRQSPKPPAVVWHAWESLFEMLDNTSGMSNFSLMIHSYGWTNAIIRKYADIIRPRFEIQNLFGEIPWLCK